MIHAFYPANGLHTWHTWRLRDDHSGDGVREPLVGWVLRDGDSTVRAAYADAHGDWQPVGPDRVVLPPGQDRPNSAQIAALRTRRWEQTETEGTEAMRRATEAQGSGQ